MLLLVLPLAALRAQSVSDDTEQLLLDVQKLAQLKQILVEMEQAYTITHAGYESIKSLSQGTFSLHQAFLDGLLAVNPGVASYWKVMDIVNKEAVEDTGLEPLCHVVDSAEAFRSLVTELSSKPFTRGEISSRETILGKLFNQENNLQKLLHAIW